VLVHNGSLSNHNRLRQVLARQGVEFLTDKDSEMAADYLTLSLREGASPDEALDAAIRDLDGFYTFAVGTRDRFAVLRDPIACKHAVLAETDDWIVSRLPNTGRSLFYRAPRKPRYASLRQRRYIAGAVPDMGELDLAGVSLCEANRRRNAITYVSNDLQWRLP
jgi:glutamate synthase domain-containing protein 1